MLLCRNKSPVILAKLIDQITTSVSGSNGHLDAPAHDAIEYMVCSILDFECLFKLVHFGLDRRVNAPFDLPDLALHNASIPT